MGIWDRLRKTEHKTRKHMESALGADRAGTVEEVHRKILDELESRIRIESSGKFFRYGKVSVLIQQLTKSQCDAFDEAFCKNDLLKADILNKMKSLEVRYPDAIEIEIELQTYADLEKMEGPPKPLITLQFLKPDSLRRVEVPETILVVSRGSAAQATYTFKKERILIGSLPEVLDREGRMVRRNDVVFLDNGDDINSTVGIIHARIWFDFEKREYYVMDEASRYGTRIVREGRTIDLPSGSDRGIRLRPGDEIYCGLACLRFEPK